MGIASLMSGWAAGQGLRQRLRVLHRLRLALELMQAEMELHMPSVAELFETVGERVEGETGRFFVGAAVEMAAVSGRSPQTAMRIQLEREPLPVQAEDKAVILEIGGCLGRYDLGGQARALGLYKTRLDRRIQSLEERQKQKSGAWMTAAVCSGLTVIVLLL